MHICLFRCQNELKGFFGTAKEDEDLMSGNVEVTERQRLCASVRRGERVALQVRVSSDRLYTRQPRIYIIKTLALDVGMWLCPCCVKAAHRMSVLTT